MSTLPIIWKSSDASYEEARTGRIFNRRLPDRYPFAIVEASKEGHVIEAVKLAAEKRCRISVRSGGHSWPAASVRDDAIMIDFGHYHEMELDENTGIVKVSPSTTSKQLNDFLLPKGRMFYGGHCPDVALGGFLLQGGMGWATRGSGTACEQIVAIDVVTADGRLIRADEKDNTELFWAARGAGMGFPGIITRFYLQTRPARKVMRSSAYIYPISQYHTAFNWVFKLTSTFDEDTEIVMICTYPPGMDELHDIILFVTFKDSEEEATKALQPAQDSFPSGSAAHWFCQETSLEKEYANQAMANPAEHRYLVDSVFVKDGEDVVKILEKALTTSPSKETYNFWYPLNPWSRRDLPDMALSLRTNSYLALYAIWKDAKDDDNVVAWMQGITQDVKKYSVGAYLGDIDMQIRTTKFWSDENAKKLMAIRRKYDPEGRICGYLDAGDQSGVKGLDNQLDA